MKLHAPKKSIIKILRHPGFTLLETVLYLALFTLLMGSVVLTVYYLIQENTRIQAKTIVYQEGNFLFRKLDWAFQGATSVQYPVAGTTDSQLRLVKISGPVELQLSSGKVQLKQGAGLFVDLNNDFVTVTNLSFQHVVASGGKPASVVTTFTISDNFGNNNTFNHTRNLRQ